MGQELDPWVLPRLTNKQKTVTKEPTMFLTMFCAELVSQPRRRQPQPYRPGAYSPMFLFQCYLPCGLFGKEGLLPS